MKCVFSLASLITALSLIALAGCSPAGKQLMGDPQNPYPLTSPPKVGDIVHLPTGTLVNLAQMQTIAGDARVVYVGETHDNPASHRLELQILQGMEERHPGKTALGMEMFNRSQQPVLDRWVAGELDEKAFLKESHWFDNWKMDFAYYRDLLIFARDRHIPVIGLNAEKSLVQAVTAKPLDQLSPEQKAQLPQMDLNDPYQRGMAESIFAGHSHGKLILDGFLRAQTLWDESMAETAARFLASPGGKDRHLVVVAGTNHISHGYGIPRRVFRRVPTSYQIIGGHEIVVSAEKQKEFMDVELPDYPMIPFDFVSYLAYEELPETGVKLGVAYEPTPGGGSLVVNSVVPGSNAERAGVKQGDKLLSLDGEALTDAFDLIYAMKQKHVGDRSTLLVERLGEQMKLQVQFEKTKDAHQQGKP
jgi:uncharacterized iron-regulated protein